MRILPALAVVASLLPATASAGDPAASASHAEALRALDAAEEALNGPRTLSDGGADRDATAALRDLAVALPALDGEERERARDLLERPTDPGDRNYFGPEAPSSPTCTAAFCVHWTDKPGNAPASNAFVDEVVVAMQRSIRIESGDLGWRGPKPDGVKGKTHGKGGGGQTDVYITNLGRGLYGFAAADPGQGGAVRRYAYLVLDNDYVGFPSGPLNSMRVTVAHELNHILQFNYDVFQDLWMFESTATWMEEQVYSEIDDYLNYLPTFAQSTELPLIGKKKVYADSVWNFWLQSRHGAEVVRDAWAASPTVTPRHDAVASYDHSIGAAGGRSFGREFSSFAAITAEWRASSNFPDAEDHPDMMRRGRLAKRARNLKLDGTAYRLFRVNTKRGQTAKLSLEAERGTDSSVALVGRDGPIGSGDIEVAKRYLRKGGRGSVKLTDAGFERVTAVVVNADGRRGRNGRYLGDDSRYRIKLRKKR